jgi:hypothetical protein
MFSPEGHLAIMFNTMQNAILGIVTKRAEGCKQWKIFMPR